MVGRVRKLGQHLAGTELKPSVKVVSSTVSNGRRTVVLSRPRKGATADYYTFATTAKDATVQFISAVGSGAKFGYHKNKAISSLAFLPVGKSGACVCPEKPKAFGQASGKLVYHAVANQSVDVGAGAEGDRLGKSELEVASAQALGFQSEASAHALMLPPIL